MTKFYAGIGSRSTPLEVCIIMQKIALYLGHYKWVLRSGHASGADRAFEDGAHDYPKEIFLPWYGFNDAPLGQGFIVPPVTEAVEKIAKQYHPVWSQLSSAAKLLHCRNVNQILGADLTQPVKMVICWTPKGTGGGGTGQAIRIARGYGIPVFDLALPETEALLSQFVKNNL